MTESIMELHELESAWKTLDQRVAAQALDIERLREATMAAACIARCAA